jgi:hypothetical protein
MRHLEFGTGVLLGSPRFALKTLRKIGNLSYLQADSGMRRNHKAPRRRVAVPA